MLIENISGHYWHMKGIDPYSCGVVAESGWEIVHVTRTVWEPWRKGFEFIDEYLKDAGLPRCALCAVELRSPEPYSMQGFIEFNRGYREQLQEWRLLEGGLNPIARTNVVPIGLKLKTPSLHAFSYVRPNPKAKRPTFIVAGAGELRDGPLAEEGIVRRGETSASAIKEKADFVLGVMSDRLRGLGVDWSLATTVNVYTEQSIARPLRSRILRKIGPAARLGFCWQVMLPPVKEIEFEMDVRGVGCELHL